ncbi:hypothetical protein [Segetibacter koreensis]|uniref:hypothetical protein n=1 Tax=Segetibacter koreensis TaxID=398037 RepID=UPI00037CC35C|nr:hypothetical protein [Segetibacter koreensis]
MIFVLVPKEGQFDAILLKTRFGREDIGRSSISSPADHYIQQTRQLLDKVRPLLKDGGLLFIWGLPNYLPFLGQHLSDNKEDANYLFKYWISVELKASDNEGLPSSHLGLLMYLKSKSVKSTTPFHLNLINSKY